jgi:hypothetical protein
MRSGDRVSGLSQERRRRAYRRLGQALARPLRRAGRDEERGKPMEPILLDVNLWEPSEVQRPLGPGA